MCILVLTPAVSNSGRHLEPVLARVNYDLKLIYKTIIVHPTLRANIPNQT